METTLHLLCCMSWIVRGNMFTRITMYVTYCPLKQLHTNYFVRSGFQVKTGLHLLDYQIALETTRDLRKGKQTFHNVFIVIFYEENPDRGSVCRFRFAKSPRRRQFWRTTITCIKVPCPPCRLQKTYRPLV